MIKGVGDRCKKEAIINAKNNRCREINLKLAEMEANTECEK